MIWPLISAVCNLMLFGLGVYAAAQDIGYAGAWGIAVMIVIGTKDWTK